jgi:D-alanine-D-alanine ligase
MNRKTVLLLFGGESSEHDVSVASARNVFAALDDTKYEVVLGYIDRQGRWWLIESLGSQLSTHGASQLMPALGAASFVTMPNNRIIKPDVILPILHGKNGEDGSVPALAQLLHIPIVGCDMTSSAICMDKVATKELLSSYGIKVVAYKRHHKSDALPDFNKLSMQLGSPVFVKPSRAGSSVGVSKVHTEEEFISALEKAHKHDDVVLIEAGVAGREIEVAVLGNYPDVKASSPGEVRADREFYSYESKYSPESKSELIIPARLDALVANNVRMLAKRAYELLGCSGLTRVDFFLDNNGTIYLNELNTLPGFTNISMYAKLWRHDGISYSELIERLISLALHATIKPNETEE